MEEMNIAPLKGRVKKRVIELAKPFGAYNFMDARRNLETEKTKFKAQKIAELTKESLNDFEQVKTKWLGQESKAGARQELADAKTIYEKKKRAAEEKASALAEKEYGKKFERLHGAISEAAKAAFEDALKNKVGHEAVSGILSEAAKIDLGPYSQEEVAKRIHEEHRDIIKNLKKLDEVPESGERISEERSPKDLVEAAKYYVDTLTGEGKKPNVEGLAALMENLGFPLGEGMEHLQKAGLLKDVREQEVRNILVGSGLTPTNLETLMPKRKESRAFTEEELKKFLLHQSRVNYTIPFARRLSWLGLYGLGKRVFPEAKNEKIFAIIRHLGIIEKPEEKERMLETLQKDNPGLFKAETVENAYKNALLIRKYVQEEKYAHAGARLMTESILQGHERNADLKKVEANMPHDFEKEIFATIASDANTITDPRKRVTDHPHLRVAVPELNRTLHKLMQLHVLNKAPTREEIIEIRDGWKKLLSYLLRPEGTA